MKNNVKAGPLSKVDIFYIEHNMDKGIEQLAKDLVRSKHVIEKKFNEIMENARERREATADSKDERPESQMMKLMGKRKRKGQTTSVIMTPAASELADTTRSSRVSKKLESAIHKPLGE